VPRPKAVPAPGIPNLPIPDGFESVETTGVASYPARFRASFAGPLGKGELVSFFRTEMPLVRWRETLDSDLKDRYHLRFDRDGDVCTIEISDAGFLALGRSVVTIELGKQDASKRSHD